MNQSRQKITVQPKRNRGNLSSTSVVLKRPHWRVRKNRIPWPHRRRRPPTRQLAGWLMGKQAPKEAETSRTRHQKDRTAENRSASRILYSWISSNPHHGLGRRTRRHGEIESSSSNALRTHQFRTGAGGGDVRTARGGNWTWSGAWCADDGCARGVAGRASALDAGTASLIIRGRCPHGEANEKQVKGGGAGN